MPSLMLMPQRSVYGLQQRRVFVSMIRGMTPEVFLHYINADHPSIFHTFERCFYVYYY